jgi:peptide/nickel transport system substrate-binding protein
VKYSIDKVLSDDFQAWNKSYVDGLIESVEVVDEQTVDVKLTGPSTRLVRELTTLDIIDPAHDATGAQETDPVGTGPFLFESFTPRQEIRLTANPDWWGDGPGVDELIVRIIPDQSTRVAALEAGEVQMIDTLPFQSIESIQNGANTTVLTGDTVRLIFLALNNKTAPFDDPLVRQAVNYAIDKNQITETILQGSALVPGGPCAPGVLDCLTDLEYPFDPDRAKSLLAEAGYAGEPLELTIGTGRYPNDDLVGQALAKMLEDVGFNVTLNVIDFASMRSQMSEAGADSPFDMWMVGWSASDNVLTSMLQSLFVADSAAYAIGYDNPEVTRLLDAASNTADPAVTTENVQEAQQIIWDEAPVGFLYVPKQNIGVSKDLSGFEPRFDEYFFFWDATLS